MQSNLKKLFKKNYERSKRKNNILLLKLDDILQETNEALNKISKKFNLKLSNNLKKALKEQDCPRKINYFNRSLIKKKLLKNLSPKFRNIFKKMIYQYENQKKVF